VDYVSPDEGIGTEELVQISESSFGPLITSPKPFDLTGDIFVGFFPKLKQRNAEHAIRG
jgi:hypothetical protein